MKIGIRRIELLFFIITMLFCSNKIFASAYTGGTGSTVISTLPKDNEKETSDSGSSSSSTESSSSSGNDSGGTQSTESESSTDTGSSDTGESTSTTNNGTGSTSTTTTTTTTTSTTTTTTTTTTSPSDEEKKKKEEEERAAAEAAEAARKAQEEADKKAAKARVEAEKKASVEKERKEKLENQIQTLRAEITAECKITGACGINQARIQELAKLDKELSTARIDFETAVAKYEKENQEVKNEENTPKGGDPVQLTTGRYEMNESDISVSGIQEFEIQRRYVSGNPVISSFGYGWITNLDQRIILGINFTAENEYKQMLSYLEKYQENIAEAERDIIESYKVSSLENGEEEIRESIRKCENYGFALQILANQNRTALMASESQTTPELTSEELSLITLEQIQSEFNQEYMDYTEEGLTDFIEEQRQNTFELAASAEALAEAAFSKALEIEGYLSSFKQSLEELDILKHEYEIKVHEAEAFYEAEVAPSLMRHQQNRRVLFSGMEEFYEGTGLDSLTVIDENGYPHILYETADGSGVWKNENDREIISCCAETGGYRLFMSDGSFKDFDSAGFLVKLTDRNGNWISLNRNGEEKILRLESSLGEKYSFEYKGNYIGKISNLRSSDENVVYGYRGNRLESVKDTDGDTVIMGYDTDGFMTSLTKCDGSKVVFEYGEITADGKRLATYTINEEGHAEYFNYDRSGKKTVYTDHDGNSTVTCYDEKHRICREEKPDGRVTVYHYDSKDNFDYTSENGALTRFEYDEAGRKNRANYPDGSYEGWTYYEYGSIKSWRDRDGVVYEYIRDERENLREYRINGKKVLSQEVDGCGLIRSQTVYGQYEVTTLYDYDDYGNVKSQSCGGVTTSYDYDGRNRIKKIYVNQKLITEYKYEDRKTIRKDLGGLVTTYLTNGRKDITEIIQQDDVTKEIHKTRIEYDKRHLPVRVYAGDGSSEKLTATYLYTAEGKLRAEISHGAESWIKLYNYINGEISEIKQFKATSPVAELSRSNEPVENIVQRLLQSAGENVYIEKYSRKQLGNNELRITVTDGLGVQKLFEYDSFGNLVKQTDGNGEVTERRFRNGILREEQDSFGGWYEYGYTDGILTKAGEKGAKALETKYYPDGSINYTVNRYGKRTIYDYDNRGRVTSLQSENQKIWYEYDIYDRVTKELIGNSKNESSAVYYVTYDYSEDKRSVTVTEGGKYKTLYELDAFGNLLKETDGNGNTKRFEYDCQNQLVAEYDGYGNKTSYEYNALGQVSKVTLPDGASSDYLYNHMGLLEKIIDDCGTVYTAVYDKADRLKKERARADSEKTYEYDNAGRIKKIWYGGEVVESYSYSDKGRVVTVKDGNGNDYLYNYDGFGRLRNERNRIGLVQQYVYDDDGQVKSQSRFDGTSTTIIYSSDRTVRTVKYSDGSESRFVYDMAGNITEAQNAYGKTLYQYDKGGRLIYQKDITTGEEISFEYDATGNRTRLYSSNRDTSYAYGSNNEVKEIFDNKQRVSVKLAYNKNGSEVLRKFGNGTSEETLYDKAGRVIVRLQKSERNELLWAEGYVYGDDGKRTATVDKSGRLTLYEYNKKGQLEKVYYPYTQEMIENLKSEAGENGLPVNIDIGENQYLTSELRGRIVPLLNAMQYGLAYSLPNMQSFIKESYAYDGNGNRIGKTTKHGTINYSYDKENCLISSGSRGQAFVNYTYDNAGNLLTEESANRTTKYAYNAQNRLIYCEVLDKAEKTYAQTTYAYDAFGRRVLVQDKDEAAFRTLYDGLTFDVIKQSPVMANGLFTDSAETGIRWSPTGKPTGDRYRYISDEDAQDGNRYFYLDENTYKTVNTRYRGTRTAITVNCTITAQITDEGSQYFTTDLLGSVSSVTDSYGTQKASYTYDAFGTLIQGDLSGTTDFGYLGKQNDPTSRLYNYGYRDYKPNTARFTTVDPIRDGENWFAYCNGDPVNFVDLFGLDVFYTIYRDIQSYDISTNRKTPKNTYLDVGVLYNSNTNETVAFERVQSVANYPSTDGEGKRVPSVYNDTIKAGTTFELRIGTTTNIASGKAAVISNAMTIDGRKVNANGYTENALSGGRGLQHSNTNPKTNQDYKNPYSKQCIILPGQDNELFFEVLQDWGIQDNQVIKTTIVDKKELCNK